MILYFAYGSNLDWGQMKNRCPSALFVDTALLPKHRLAFTWMSSSRQCGVADVVFDENEDVWGSVYQINQCDLETLDRCEGFQSGRARNAYIRVEKTVFAQGNTGNPLKVMIYVVQEKEENHIPPSREYLDLIVEGARYWHLPENYVDCIEKTGAEG